MMGSSLGKGPKVSEDPKLPLAPHCGSSVKALDLVPNHHASSSITPTHNPPFHSHPMSNELLHQFFQPLLLTTDRWARL